VEELTPDERLDSIARKGGRIPDRFVGRLERAAAEHAYVGTDVTAFLQRIYGLDDGVHQAIVIAWQDLIPRLPGLLGSLPGLLGSLPGLLDLLPGLLLGLQGLQGLLLGLQGLQGLL
jgi:hypothetical protein